MFARLGLIFLLTTFSQLQLFLPQALAQEESQWVSSDGKSVTGEFLRLEGKTVVIKLATGSEAKVPLSSLSFESHLQALKLAKPEAFSKELIKAPEVVQAVEPPTVVPVTSVLDSPFGDDPTIDQFLRTAVGEWKRGNNFIVWHMLPPRMQQDLLRIVGNTTQGIGMSSLPIFKNTVTTLASLASKKRDWLVSTELAKLPLINEAAEQPDKSWPILVGILEKLSSPELWEAKNFEPNGMVPWLASLSELFAYSRQLDPELNEISYNIVSQSADRAEVEAAFGDRTPQTINFQKVGNIWVVPEFMNALRAEVDKELTDAPPNLQTLRTMQAGLAFLGPVLNKMDQAKTQEEFQQVLAQSGMSQMLSGIPSSMGQGGAAGSRLPGIPFPIPGLPPGFLGPSGGQQ